MAGKGNFIVGLILVSVFLIVSAATAEAQTAYFVVAQPALYAAGFGDSYILPLTDLDDISLARVIVAMHGFKIVVANITVGADGINRDVLAEGMPQWSWHVIEFLGFADMAIELCDGGPTLTETEVQSWSAGDEGMICYWAYTVVEEVQLEDSSNPTTWGGIKALFEK
jgi:hypothetical protein